MCGIAGIITKTPRTFDYATFCVLGIVNDSRGGDSCGVFIDGKYEYGVDKKKFFQNYYLGSDFLFETQKSSVAFLHCRKASVGNVSEATAQPVVICDKNGKVLYVLMHNGTIHNYRDLAEKYIPETNITGMTDSQVMARIFFNSGYAALDEYNGGAVFVIADYRKGSPKILLFKGASKKTEYSKEIEEERPLFYCIDKSKRELVFSSIGIYLPALRKDCYTYSLKENVLVEFDGKNLVPVEEHPRTDAIQSKKTVVSPYIPISGYKGYKYLDDDDDDVAIYDSYIFPDRDKNLYKFKGTPLHSKVHLSWYGKICNSKQPRSCEVHFFHGVPLKNVHCFRFLATLKRETKLSDKEFFEKFENLIRFLSIDGLYKKDGLWYKAVSPTESKLYSGTYQNLTAASQSDICAGRLISTTWGAEYTYMENKLKEKSDINFKTIREQCKSLMK